MTKQSISVFLGILLLSSLYLNGSVWAEADGPDFYSVTGVTGDDVLNIREKPDAESAKVGEAPHDAVGLRNLGCNNDSFSDWSQMTERERDDYGKNRWCKIEYKGVSGWVRGKFLTEQSDPSIEESRNAEYEQGKENQLTTPPNDDSTGLVSKTDQNLDNPVDQSKGGYKNFFFDMNKERVSQEIKNLCPDSPTQDDSTLYNQCLSGDYYVPYSDGLSPKEKCSSLNSKVIRVKRCIELKGEKRDTEFDFNEQNKLKRISIDLGSTYGFIVRNNNVLTGIADFDEWLERFETSEKYKTYKIPTSVEKDRFNRSQPGHDPSGNVMFYLYEDKMTNNLVALILGKTISQGNATYRYDYTLNYTDKNESDVIRRNQENKVINDDDL